MPRISVFTPSHDPKWLDEAHASLLRQGFTAWEWIVVLNGGAQWTPASSDPRIKIAYDSCITGVGAAKRRACELATGDILLELDHDDLLTRDALAAVDETFAQHPEAGLVYSRTAQITADGQRDEGEFSAAHGWVYDDVEVDGQTLKAARLMAPTPHNVSLIWYAPNHLRAFTRRAYDAVGGYNSRLTILDDQDLMSRLYQYGEFHPIDKVLYLQRVHSGNTQSVGSINDSIQEQTYVLYEQHIEANALAWAKREGLLALDLGAAHSKAPGFLGVDMHPVEGVDLVATLPNLPLGDNSVGVIRAHDFMEHVDDKIGLINEFYRVLAPGGMLLSFTPSSDGRGAYQDPTHVAFYNENSFWYYTDANYTRFVPEIEARFQASRLVTFFPSDWHAHWNISYVRANLIALKPGAPRNGGFVLFDC